MCLDSMREYFGIGFCGDSRVKGGEKNYEMDACSKLSFGDYWCS